MNSEDVRALIWDDDKIREAFIYDGGESEYHDPINGAKEQRRIAGDIFDRWLEAHDAKVRAEASAVSTPDAEVSDRIERVLHYAEQAVSDVGAWEEVAALVEILARRSPKPAVSTTDPEALARRFHEAYERLAPEFGYKTRDASAVPWEDVPEANKRLMIATCAAVSTPPIITDDDEATEFVCGNCNAGIPDDHIGPKAKITDDMVERAARSLAGLSERLWVAAKQDHPGGTDYYIDQATAALAAALHPGGETNG